MTRPEPHRSTAPSPPTRSDRTIGGYDLTGSALQLAPRLLGAVLTTHIDGARVSVRLVEVEAYEGDRDPGSHAYRGRTARNQVMFADPGHLYIYRHLGLHHCVNLVCGPPGIASALLLRAGEVVDGRDVALDRRQRAGVCRTPRDLARGPGRLTVALALTAVHNGATLSTHPHGPVHLRWPERPAPHGAVSTGARVGVNGPGGDGDRYPWRFWLAGDQHVSAFRAGRVSSPGREEPSKRAR